MKDYAPFRFRPAFALGAVALSAATLALTVFLPAAVSPVGTDATAMAAQRAAPDAIEVTIIPAHIDVIGMRDDKMHDESVAATPARESVRRTSLRS